MARVAAISAWLAVGVDAVRMAKNKGSVRNCGALGAASDELNMSIVNGQPASECEWKWQVGLFTTGGNGPYCGGTIISDEWVLCAAHCMGQSSFNVKAGDWKTNSVSGKEQTRAAVEFYSHPSYNSNTMTHDYALIKVSPPFDFNDCVGQACLPTNDVVGGEECMITGWGTLSSGGSQPTTMQEAAVTIISNADCTGNFGYGSNEIDESMICAQGMSPGGITDACQGDSGGPLVCKSGNTWEVQGATSWGYGCAGANFPGVWARVYEELDWIEDTMAGVPQPTPPPTPAPVNFVCNNGCDINDSYQNDGWCDCSECEDEGDYTCSTCSGGCPNVCGGFEMC